MPERGQGTKRTVPVLLNLNPVLMRVLKSPNFGIVELATWIVPLIMYKEHISQATAHFLRISEMNLIHRICNEPDVDSQDY